MKTSIALRAAAVSLATLVGAGSALAAEVTGAGASFVFPLMASWSADYNAASGHRINYQSIGSSGGIAQVKAATVDFGSSDAPLSSADLSAAGLIQFPAVIGGVVPVIHVAGIDAGQLKLTGPILADIFRGKITRWNDDAIVAANAGLDLPSATITVVHRSDGSGTTFNFVNYLSKVSPAFRDDVGEGTSVKWPLGVGGKGNEGVAAYVKQIKNSIGYVELAYALQNKMSHTQLQNAAGHFVQPSAASFAAAAASADWATSTDFNLVITNAAGDEAWPITATNFILMPANPKDPARAQAARDFFSWAYSAGKQRAAALDYVPLPDTLVSQIQAYWLARAK